MIVLDTNVVSELMRSARDRRVEAWARGLTVETAITAITLGELLAGVRRLPEGTRKDRLCSLVRDVTAPYEAQGLVLPFDTAAADQYAEVLQGRRELVAETLHVHPQTVRYRMNQVRGLYGERLADPDEVFALVLALGR